MPNFGSELEHFTNAHQNSCAVKVSRGLRVLSQETSHVEALMFKCWASVADVGPTLKHHCFNVLCLLCEA